MLGIYERLWLIGGTTESAALAQEIAAFGLPCTVTVTTQAAESLYPNSPMLRIQVGRLDAAQVERFLQEQRIAAVLDASHPFAVEISKLAEQAAASRQIPYLRFERRAVDDRKTNSRVIVLDSFDALVGGDYLHQQRVLLTVGYKALPLLQQWQDRSTLFARILPSVPSLEAAIAAGFSAERIIALRPPVTAQLEKALWRHWDISLVVTKASGVAGGEDVKRVVATELGIPLIVIKRPVVDYSQRTSDISIALEFCRTHVASRLTP